MTPNCIDVSTWNTNVDYNKVKAAGIKAVIIRAGFGRELYQKDNQFETHYTNAKAAGLKIGIYWYSYSSGIDDSAKEARACISILKGKKIDLPVYYDMEESSLQKFGKTALTIMAETFCEEIKMAGYKAGVYANPYWFNNFLDYNYLKNKYSIWLAQWGVSKPSRDCDIWQYAEDGKVNGISGNCDVNIIYNSGFIGSSTVESKTINTSKSSTEVLNWQKSMNIGFDFTGDSLVEDGIFGPACTAFAKTHTIYKGIKNAPTAVKWLQNKLNIKADGIFGPATETAVKTYQKQNNLTVDGVVGYNTTKSLLKV